MSEPGPLCSKLVWIDLGAPDALLRVPAVAAGLQPILLGVGRPRCFDELRQLGAGLDEPREVTAHFTGLRIRRFLPQEMQEGPHVVAGPMGVGEPSMLQQ